MLIVSKIQVIVYTLLINKKLKFIVLGRDSLGALIRTRQFDFFPSFNRHIRIEEGENSLKNI